MTAPNPAPTRRPSRAGRLLRRLVTVRPRVLDLLILVLIAALVAGTVALIRRSDSEQERAAAAAAAAQEPISAEPVDRDPLPAVLWIGDGYVTGSAEIGPATAYPSLVCRRLGWSCNVDAQDTTGFLNPGNPGAVGGLPTATFGDRLPATVDNFYGDIIVVDGGHEDLSYPTDQLGAAIDSYLRSVRAAWPAATVLVVVPEAIGYGPDPGYYQLSAAIDASAADVGATVIDPIALGWFGDIADRSTLVSADGRSPSALGNAYLAGRFESEFVALGLAPPGTDRPQTVDIDSGTPVQFGAGQTTDPAAPPAAADGTGQITADGVSGSTSGPADTSGAADISGSADTSGSADAAGQNSIETEGP
ncbi:SGNH/GDSL hydrolase family protein [Millisia brevis]|uniref:SGNH/GDSL hydrolase family protein n=1 Tax=Millisia brevis TaxID=264148 RepID=UPI00083274BE|nr:GDSL-type esterase/lipase family protein [Millisia brevis]